MEEKDFRRAQKLKQQEFKQDLDRIRQNHHTNVGLYNGMTETEILLNQDQFKELGLIWYEVTIDKYVDHFLN